MFKRTLITNTSEEEKISIIQEIQTAVDLLKTSEKGASIVIDVKNETNEYVTDSELIDSRITSNLMINIFEGSKTPLHDGAIIIKNNRIDRASAYITNLSQQPVPKKFGTRHRSALGLSEVTKAIIIVLSEETGKIRIFFNSKYEDVNQRDLFGRIVDLWV
ncbi:MAG: DNA integrity scanning protein DisA nucleotide-binding domain protein [Mycoplasmataceae bacterium]|nr:DNA integrity scanning protein DisA nucleotide-binding domain protein [Mycoplasmataceae bacterium]